MSSQLPGSGYTYSYSFSGGKVYSVSVNLPDASQRWFYFDPAGYVVKDVRNPSNLPETTVFTRDQQTIGTLGTQGMPGYAPGTTEFIGEVQEEDPSSNVLRQTMYNYDSLTGNILSTQVSPRPGESGCCTNFATWSYTYTTFNRLASAVEPLAYNNTGTTYTYVDQPSTPTMTVTDPFGNSTIVTYNSQGQPISTKDPIGNTSQITYYSNGDVKSTTDASGATIQYVTDVPGRVVQTTSPLNELTTYAYDAEDHVTDAIVDPNGLNPLHSQYTYDLIGEILTSIAPNGMCPNCIAANYTTTWTRNAALTQTTVTDPRGNSTITTVDGQGGVNNFYDKRGVETAYTYDVFGRLGTVTFNANNKSPSDYGYQFSVVAANWANQFAFGAYDALDRPAGMTIYQSACSGNCYQYDAIGFTYDGVDNKRSETETPGEILLPSFTNQPGTANRILNYFYDFNGRRTQMTSSLNGNTLPTVNYGYDCADELVSMSNDGSALTSCGSSTFVGYNGNYSTQTAHNYDADGALANSVANGIETVFTRDADERPTLQTFQTYPGGSSFGTLSYKYDLDGRLWDKGGTLAAINLPGNETATYSETDQIAKWNGTNVTYDGSSDDVK